MSLFENFPYSNLHNLNLDWVLAKVRALIADYIQMHDDFNTFTQDTEQAVADLKDYVDNYLDNMDIPEYIRETIAEMLDSGALAEVFSKINSNATINLIGEYSCNMARYEYNPGGFCYIGNGSYIILCRTSEEEDSDNYVDVIRYTLSNNSVEERLYRHLMYHANTCCYNPNTNRIYVASGFEKVGDVRNYQPYIYVLDPEHLDVIENTITLPNNLMATNIAYDRTEDAFYIVGFYDASNDPITTNFGKLFKFTDDTFAANPIEIRLEDDPRTAALLRSSYQGCHIEDGVLYQQYDFNLCAIATWDIKTGQLIAIYNVPYTMNRCKRFIEMEDITYDPDRQRFVFLSASLSGREHSCPICNIADISFGAAIPEFFLSRTYHRAGTGAPVDIRIYPGDTTDCRPVTETGIFRSIYDAEYYSETLQYEKPQYNIQASMSNTTGGEVKLSNFTLTKSFRMAPRSGDTVVIGNISLRRVLSAEFDNCKFYGIMSSSSEPWGDFSLPKANIYIYFNCHAIFNQCKFNYNENNDIVHGINVYNGGRVTLMAGNGYQSNNPTGQQELVYAYSRAYVNLLASTASPENVARTVKFGTVDTVEINRYYQIYKGDISVGQANQVSIPFQPPANGEAYITVGGSSNAPMGIGMLISTRSVYNRYVMVPKEDRTGFYLIKLRIASDYLRIDDVKVWSEDTNTITAGPTTLQNFTLNIKM